VYLFAMIVCLVFAGIGLFVFKKARTLSEWSHDFAGDWDILPLSFTLWIYRVFGIILSLSAIVLFGLCVSQLI
jgi:hypothetical protein